MVCEKVSSQTGFIVMAIGSGDTIEQALNDRVSGQCFGALALMRLVLMFVWLVLLLPPYVVCRWCGGRFNTWGRWFYSGLLWVANIRTQQHWPDEQPPTMIDPADKPTLVVGNHVSFLDIAIVAAHAEVAFVAANRGKIPSIYQFIADLGDTIFISRKNWRSIGEQIRNVRRVKTIPSRRLVLFGEGTTSDGISILPFRSSLFAAVVDTDAVVSTDKAQTEVVNIGKVQTVQMKNVTKHSIDVGLDYSHSNDNAISVVPTVSAASPQSNLTYKNPDRQNCQSGDPTYADSSQCEDQKKATTATANMTADIMVQPFVLFYRSYAGIPITPDLRDVFAWYGKMPFGAHFWRLLSMPGPLEVDLMWLPPIDPNTLITSSELSSCKMILSRRTIAHTVRENICKGYNKLRLSL